MKVTNPLAKSFLTGEGILVYAVNIGLAVATAIPGTISLTHSAIFITIITVLHAISRVALKVTAIQKGFGVAPPVVDPIDPQEIASDVADILAASGIGGTQAADPAPPAPSDAVTT